MREPSPSYSHTVVMLSRRFYQENKERQLNIIALTISVFYMLLFVYLTVQRYELIFDSPKKKSPIRKKMWQKVIIIKKNRIFATVHKIHKDTYRVVLQ